MENTNLLQAKCNSLKRRFAINAAAESLLHEQRLDALSEINDRLITPLFIPSIIVLSFFLIITNKEKVNFFILRGLIFILGISTVIFADILVDFSSKNIKANIFLYIVPFLLFLINLFFLNRLLKNENIKK